MSRHQRKPAQRYHDRVAGQYDAIYDDAYWHWHDRLTWDHLRAFLPRRAGLRALDLGCGTGKWGFRLLEAGLHVTFVDISAAMLDQARDKVADSSYLPRAAFVHADLADLSALESHAFHFALALGEPIGCTASPAAALGQVRRLLAPDACLVATFDNRLACIDHLLETGDADELARFLRCGLTRWLTSNSREQFTIHTYTPAQVRQLFSRAGLEVIDIIGKTVLPMRAHRDKLADPREFRRLLAIEKGLCRIEAALGRCAHLQVAARSA